MNRAFGASEPITTDQTDTASLVTCALNSGYNSAPFVFGIVYYFLGELQPTDRHEERRRRKSFNFYTELLPR